jgi:RHS repeat-associated protein
MEAITKKAWRIAASLASCCFPTPYADRRTSCLVEATMLARWAAALVALCVPLVSLAQVCEPYFEAYRYTEGQGSIHSLRMCSSNQEIWSDYPWWIPYRPPYIVPDSDTYEHDCSPGFTRSEIPDNEIDDNGDGCIDEGTRGGKGICSCIRVCDPAPTYCPTADYGVQYQYLRTTAYCAPQQAPGTEACGDNLDNNCNGEIDEGCPPPSDAPEESDSCEDGAGDDPLVFATRSAATTPFADFSVETVIPLGLSRTYSSADISVGGRGGAPGIFGRGWHHDWEETVSCTEATSAAQATCIVSKGLRGTSTFRLSKSLPAPAPYAGEQWLIYIRHDSESAGVGDRSILVRRGPGTGDFILFRQNGDERHYAAVCDSCGTMDEYCLDQSHGGKARLVKVLDAAGRSRTVNYARPSGVFLSVADDLGNLLELKSASACAEGLVRELWFNDAKYVTYEYSGVGGKELQRALDIEGRALRSYSYEPGGSGRLLQVLNEGGAAIAEFSYDANGDATSLSDAMSTVSVAYTSATQIDVTSSYGTSSAASKTILLDVNAGLRATSITEGSAQRFVGWAGKRVNCTVDALGRAHAYDRDAAGRVVRDARYASDGCGIPNQPPPLDEIRYEYAMSREVAPGYVVPLDMVTQVKRPSVLTARLTGEYAADPYVYESYDYDASPKPLDPANYACTPGNVPNIVVLCRETTQGYTIDSATGQVVRERHATYHSYDSRGRLIESIGPVSLDRPWPTEIVPHETKTYWVDGASQARRGRLASVARWPGGTAAALMTLYDYDAFGVSSITDPSGGLTFIVKDSRGRRRFVSAPDLAVTEYRYYDGDMQRLVLLPSGVVRFGYDGRGRLAATEPLSSDPDVAGSNPTSGWVERRVYDAAGNASTVELLDGQGVVRRRHLQDFNEKHALLADHHPDPEQILYGVSTTYAYDAAGFLTDIGGAGANSPTQLVRDDLGRISTVRKTGQDSRGFYGTRDVATYTYDKGRSSLVRAVDGVGKYTDYINDDFARLLSVGQTTTLKVTPSLLVHDARGNTVRRIAGASTTETTYDGMDRVTKVVATNGVDGSTVTILYTYDLPGQLGLLASITEVETGRTTSFTYDPVGRLRFETVTEPGSSVPLTTEHRYDANGAVDTLVYPSGLSVKFVRDTVTRRVAEVRNVSSGLKYAANVTHWPQGPISSLVFGNGTTLSQTYNLRYEPASIASGPLSLAYTMTAPGNVYAVQSGGTTTTFEYDFMGRLMAVDPGFGDTYVALRYTYSGDRVKEAWGIASGIRKYAFGYDDRTNLSAVTTYDASGTTLTSTTCLVHDALSRLIAVGPAKVLSGPDALACRSEADLASVQVRFRYDGKNRRVGRWDAGTGSWTVTTVLPDGSPLSEQVWRGTNWETTRQYVWLDGRPLAQLDAGLPSYLHVDHIGLPRAMTGTDGQVVWAAEARPYGDVVETVTGVATNLRLPGQYDERLLGSLGLQGPYYNWNRWYLPGVGRYLELDPIALQGGLNGEYGPDWYSYAQGNPLIRLDPTGRSPILVGVGVGIGVGASVGIAFGFLKCMEKCLGVKIGLPIDCDNPVEINRRQSKCLNYCAAWASIASCVGLGEAALCTITTIEQQVGGGGG